MPETTITSDEVEREHLAEVHQVAHWAYLFGVVALGFVAMVLLIAWLGSAAL
jgi:hypothetical protein